MVTKLLVLGTLGFSLAGFGAQTLNKKTLFAFADIGEKETGQVGASDQTFYVRPWGRATVDAFDKKTKTLLWRHPIASALESDLIVRGETLFLRDDKKPWVKIDGRSGAVLATAVNNKTPYYRAQDEHCIYLSDDFGQSLACLDPNSLKEKWRYTFSGQGKESNQFFHKVVPIEGSRVLTLCYDDFRVNDAKTGKLLQSKKIGTAPEENLLYMSDVIPHESSLYVIAADVDTHKDFIVKINRESFAIEDRISIKAGFRHHLGKVGDTLIAVTMNEDRYDGTDTTTEYLETFSLRTQKLGWKKLRPYTLDTVVFKLNEQAIALLENEKSIEILDANDGKRITYTSTGGHQVNYDMWNFEPRPIVISSFDEKSKVTQVYEYSLGKDEK